MMAEKTFRSEEKQSKVVLFEASGQKSSVIGQSMPVDIPLLCNDLAA